jgi:hypothetical protein
MSCMSQEPIIQYVPLRLYRVCVARSFALSMTPVFSCSRALGPGHPEKLGDTAQLTPSGRLDYDAWILSVFRQNPPGYVLLR